MPDAPVPNPQSPMTNDDSAVADAVALLSQYNFELKGYRASELVSQWLKTYSAVWIRLAVIEALYQGRYKAFSVEQILAGWARRDRPLYRFNHEFERLVCRKLPHNLINDDTSDLPDLPEEDAESETDLNVTETINGGDWTRPEAGKSPIDRFKPTGGDRFYLKLKAVAEKNKTSTEPPESSP